MQGVVARRLVGGLAAVGVAAGAVPHVVALPVVAIVGPLTIGSALATWTFSPLVVTGTMVALVAYLEAVRRVDAAHPATPVPLWRVACWVAGVVVIFLALSSFVDVYATDLFSIHMIQHLLLMMVGAPLLALGAPMTLLLRVASAEQRRRWILPVLHSRLIRLITHPLVTWALFSAVLWISHFSQLYELSLQDERIHVLEHLLYVVSAYLFWLPVVGADPIAVRLPYPVRLGYLVLQMPQTSFLSLSIWQAGAVLYPHYAAVQVPGWLSPLADQQLAGGLMLLGAVMLSLGAILLVTWAWIEHEEAEGKRIDAVLARQRQRAAARPPIPAPEPAPAGRAGPDGSAA